MVLEKKGVVFAVGWSKEWFAEHKEVTDTQKIPETLGSKYVQSKVGDSYEKVIGYISGGKQVLFVGTPCQIAGLRNVIKQERITENDVILVDLVCHGVPSLFAFKKYLKEHFETDKIESIQFRNKSKGWTRFQIVIETIDGKKYEAVYYKDSFFYGFLINLYLASICYNCPFSKIPRQGDITLGDFWGVPKEYKDERGVSVVLVNSEKGNEFFSELIEGKRIFAEQVPLEIAAKSNPRIISGRLEIPKEREQILKALNNKSWKYIARKYIKPPVGLRSIIIRRGLSFAKRMIKKIFKE
ncbi:coenzyme F420 hydrogenase/dehydrogenase subunit beta domain-containing protein [Thermotoga sp. Mc24]|nr:coenzyme F420 hydrogenase/dehydrogenase subunit beta domain-containing protein [Thermotoga sp. Mc24]